MPSHMGEVLTPRRMDISKLARGRHCHGHGTVWVGCQGDPWLRFGSSCGRLSVRQGENGSAAPTTHTTVSESMRKQQYRDPHTKSENRFTDWEAISTIATFGKYQPYPRPFLPDSGLDQRRVIEVQTVSCSPFGSLEFLLLFGLVFFIKFLLTEPIPIRAASDKR